MNKKKEQYFVNNRKDEFRRILDEVDKWNMECHQRKIIFQPIYNLFVDLELDVQ